VYPEALQLTARCAPEFISKILADVEQTLVELGADLRDYLGCP
jgi:hypothetical protein